jgi:hypothetical protein
MALRPIVGSKMTANSSYLERLECEAGETCATRARQRRDLLWRIRFSARPHARGCHDPAQRGLVSAMESTTAILLRKRKLSDTSLIIHWCTNSLGCVQTVAKGARRAKSPFAGKLDLFFEAEIQIARSKKSDLHTLREVALRNPFGGIRASYLRMQVAAYFVELVEICTESDHHDAELFALCSVRLAI